MPTAKNAAIYLEQTETGVDWAAMTDSGDHKIFTFADAVLSGRSGYEAEIVPDGVATGTNLITPATAAGDDDVDVAAFTAYFSGVLVSVSADTDIAVTRGTAPNEYIINSVVCNSSGVLSVVTGTGSTAFATGRGVAGGPPSIPIGSIEVGQVKLTSETAGVILSSEIFQSVEAGQQEHTDYPLQTVVSMLGMGNKATVSAKENAYVEFSQAIPMIHGATPTSAPTAYKPVYASYYTPVFVKLTQGTVDFVPAVESYSVSSTEYYQKSVASSATSLSAASYTSLLQDGITDQQIKLGGALLIVKFFPDENKAPYSLTQGTIGGIPSFPVADQISIAMTVAAEEATVNFDS